MKLNSITVQTIIACLLSLTAACSDYQTGYDNGYNNVEARNWLVSGRREYQEGYQQGQMQAFHDDWYAENADDIDVGLSCPAVVMRVSPVIVTEEHGQIELR